MSKKLDTTSSIATLNKAAARIVCRFLDADIDFVENIQRGMMTFKFRVRTSSNDDVIVRFYPEGRSFLVHQEPDLLLRCSRAGLPVPLPIGDSRTGPQAPLSYVAYRRIEGEVLAVRLPQLDEVRRNVLAKDLTRCLYQLSNLTFEGAGELISSLAAKDSSWSAFVDTEIRNGLAAIKKHRLLETKLINEMEEIICAGPPSPICQTNRLVWGDVNFDNILVGDDGHIAGLIDFEGCLSGDPLATLGYIAAFHGCHPFFHELLQTWPQTLTDKEYDFVAWYSLLRALRLARYAHLPLPTGRARDPFICIVPGIVPSLQRLYTNHKHD